MSKPTLVILAAGMASRYGSMKQTEGFGPNGETIMDYSIYDAIRAGFGKIVFIIREEFAAQFSAIFTEKLKGKAEVAYVYQKTDSFTQGFTIPADRVKPWGTGHALLCAGNAIEGPFAIINADDFYGSDAFQMAASFLQNKCNASTYAIVGYELRNTLSENGTVSRGVCTMNTNGDLIAVTERTKVYRKENQMVYEENEAVFPIAEEARASMNFWCFDQSVIAISKTLFAAFMEKEAQNPKAEFFLTNIGDYVIKNNIASIAVLPTNSHWFGVTYKADAAVVAEKVQALIADKTYPAQLWI